MSLLLTVSSGVALALLVAHSWRTRGRSVTVTFFLLAIFFGIVRGNLVWFVVTHAEHGCGTVRPYVAPGGLLPEIGHESLQMAVGWAFGLYLAWTVSELILARFPRFAGRVFMIAGLASLFMATLGYSMENTAMAAGWWRWTLPTRTALFGNVNTPCMWAWFSSVPDFLIPYLAIAGTVLTLRSPRGRRWLWILIPLAHGFGVLAYGRFPGAWLVHPALLLLVVGLMCFNGAHLIRGAMAPETLSTRWLATMLPALALVIFFAVVAFADLATGGGMAGLMTLVPLLILCLLAWRRFPVWGVVTLSVLALGGWAWIGPRAIWALTPVAVFVFLMQLDRFKAPLALRLVPAAVVAALCALAVVLESVETARVERYTQLWWDGRYAEAVASRPRDTLVFYGVIRGMERFGEASSSGVASDRLARIILELEEVARRDPNWTPPREDLARLRLLQRASP